MATILKASPNCVGFLLDLSCRSCYAVVRYYHDDLRTVMERDYDSWLTQYFVTCPSCGREQEVYENEFEQQDFE